MYQSLCKISSIAAELHPFFINYAFDVTCVDLAKLGIPQCITPWQTRGSNAEKFEYQSREFQGTTPDYWRLIWL